MSPCVNNSPSGATLIAVLNPMRAAFRRAIAPVGDSAPFSADTKNQSRSAGDVSGSLKPAIRNPCPSGRHTGPPNSVLSIVICLGDEPSDRRIQIVFERVLRGAGARYETSEPSGENCGDSPSPSFFGRPPRVGTT